MRPWMIALAGAGSALVIELLGFWLLRSTSLATFAITGLSLYEILVLSLTAAVFVRGLGQLRMRLAAPPQTSDEWVSLFAGSGLERLARRVIDLVPPGASQYRQTLLLHSRPEPNQVRREVMFLFRDRLRGAQFFTAFALSVAICGLSLFQAYSPTSFSIARVSAPLSLVALLAVLIAAAFGRLAVQGATEPFLDAIMGLCFERFDARLLRTPADLDQRASNARPLESATPVSQVAYQPAFERFGGLLEELVSSLHSAANKLAGNADLLASTARALSDRETNDATTLREERAADKLRSAIEELTRAVAKWPGVADGAPGAIEASARAAPEAERQTMPDIDLGDEIRELLKEFE